MFKESSSLYIRMVYRMLTNSIYGDPHAVGGIEVTRFTYVAHRANVYKVTFGMHPQMHADSGTRPHIYSFGIFESVKGGG